MERESSWIEAAQGLADAFGRGEVCRVETRGLTDAERGWSGAEVVRGEAVLSDGSRMPLILKCAERKERCAMARLTRQRQCVPASFSADLDGAAPAWMAMEDLGRQRLAPPDDRAFLRRFAGALASIHARNLDRGRRCRGSRPPARIIGGGWCRNCPSITSSGSSMRAIRLRGRLGGISRRFAKWAPGLPGR